jgi:hypothetical protein
MIGDCERERRGTQGEAFCIQETAPRCWTFHASPFLHSIVMAR